ncbi:MAG: hypothetical protein AMXMBFR53_08770 [Gemmatimonadota bacterium]
MSHDPFGNLEDWGRVLATLEKATEEGRLDEVQPGLIRLLRYRDNWRIREHTLNAARRVENPSDALVSAVLDVLLDETTFVDARILAAKALGHIGCRGGRVNGTAVTKAPSLRAVLISQLARPSAPVLTHAIEEAIRKLDQVNVTAG